MFFYVFGMAIKEGNIQFARKKRKRNGRREVV
jgi:hypothetical protein